MNTGKPSYDLNTLPGNASQRNAQKYGIIVADWNADITHPMADDAANTLKKCGINENNIHIIHVPGAVELVFAAKTCINSSFRYNAIIVVGCVIKGDTPHFDYVCNSVTNGITILNAQGVIPIIFAVLTTLNKQQAVERINGTVEKKGESAAIDAIWMANLNEQIRNT